MSEDKDVQNDIWVIGSQFGHQQFAGVVRPSRFGKLIHLDVPDGDSYRTKFINEDSIFEMSVVSEEIARVYAAQERTITPYDEPIVSKAQYEEALRLARANSNGLERQILELQRRLTAVAALPEPEERFEPGDDIPY